MIYVPNKIPAIRYPFRSRPRLINTAVHTLRAVNTTNCSDALITILIITTLVAIYDVLSFSFYPGTPSFAFQCRCIMIVLQYTLYAI
jgi:hypothetical protein